MARVGSTNFKITKMAGYAKEIDVVDESDEEIQNISQEKDAQNTKKSTKLAIQAFRTVGDLQTAEESVENLDKRIGKVFPQRQKKRRQKIQSQCFGNIKERVKKVLFRSSLINYVYV